MDNLTRFTYYESPVGTLLLVSKNGQMVRVAYGQGTFNQILDNLEEVGEHIVGVTPSEIPITTKLDSYFAEAKPIPAPADLQAEGFKLKVLNRILDIPSGETRTYTQIAVAAGSPQAARAVGTICATNLLPIIIPCHRVVPSNGAVGEYLGGVDAKRYLLGLEKAHQTERLT